MQTACVASWIRPGSVIWLGPPDQHMTPCHPLELGQLVDADKAAEVGNVDLVRPARLRIVDVGKPFSRRRHAAKAHKNYR